jgi:hypothetical protein
MPCPYFEPQRVATDPQYASARVPLLDEYDGLCHAVGEPLAVPSALRFQCCNHGYSRGCCGRFPESEARSGLRYNVVRRTAGALEILCVEEQHYAPLRWHSVQYFFEDERIEPELADLCTRAQVVAFCRSYLKRFSD